MHLAVRATPTGSEALGFAVLMAVRNFFMWGSDWLGSAMIESFHMHHARNEPPPGTRIKRLQPHDCREIPSPVSTSLFVCLAVSMPVHCWPWIRARHLFGEIDT
jgi:hypothetical protein